MMKQRLGGRYELIKEIGAGGMGSVFEALDLETGRTVAAKLMIASGELELQTLLRFQQEGAVLATLKHPNIVTVYGTFLEEHACAIVMELLKGGSVRELLKRERPSLRQTKQIALQVLSALDYAHSRGIIHRDVKPDNIMLLPDGRVKVTDFGIARVLQAGGTLNTATGTTIGTPLYMSPEQIEGQRVDGRSDIYSFGTVLYQMVTGRPPFEGEDPVTVAFKHVHRDPLPPRELNEAVPAEWEAVILKALAKKSEDRFQAAAAMREAIEALPADDRQEILTPPEPVAAPPSPEPPAEKVAVESLPVRPQPPLETVVLPRREERQVPNPQIGPSRRTLTIGGGVLAIVVAAGTGAFIASRGSQSAALAPRATVPAAQGSTGSSSSGAAGSSNSGSTGSGIPDLTGRQTGTTLRAAAGTQLASWTSSLFSQPQSIATDGKGNLYVADSGNNSILKFGPNGVRLATISVGNVSPSGIAVAQDGTIFVSENDGNRLYRMSSTGKILKTWGGTGSKPGEFNNIEGMTVDRAGNLYVTDNGNNRVQKFAPDGRLLAVWGRNGAGAGQFHYPIDVAVDGQGYVYVADQGNARVDKLDARGKYQKSWTLPSPPNSYATVGAVAADAAHGIICVVDFHTGRVLRYKTSGALIGRWGPHGRRRGRFQNPWSMAIDPRGNLYVLDRGTNRITKLAP